MSDELFNVVAVDIKTGANRLLASRKTKKDADAIVYMAVIRRGVEHEFFKLVMARKDDAPMSPDTTQPAPVNEQAGVAEWMIARSYATGHGNTVADMLAELEAQAKERSTTQPAPVDGDEREALVKIMLRTVPDTQLSHGKSFSSGLYGAADAIIAFYRSRRDTKRPEITDDPGADGSEFAHPAWWRGHDQTAVKFCEEVNQILSGKPIEGSCVEPWGSTRRRLVDLINGRSALSPEDEWRPISTAKRDGARVIGLTPWGVETVKWHVNKGIYMEPEDGWIGVEQDSTCFPRSPLRPEARCIPTHWRPLPASPADRVPSPEVE